MVALLLLVIRRRRNKEEVIKEGRRMREKNQMIRKRVTQTRVQKVTKTKKRKVKDHPYQGPKLRRMLHLWNGKKFK